MITTGAEATNVVKHGSVTPVLLSYPNKHQDRANRTLYRAACRSDIFDCGSTYVLLSSQVRQAWKAAPYVDEA